MSSGGRQVADLRKITRIIASRIAVIVIIA